MWMRVWAGAAASRSAIETMTGRLRAYIRRRMPTGPTEVEDLVQETLLAVHLQRGAYEPSFAVSAWFMVMARHKLVDLRRRRGRQEDMTGEFDAVEAAQMATEPLAHHASRDIETLLLL